MLFVRLSNNQRIEYSLSWSKERFISEMPLHLMIGWGVLNSVA
jgi:hypothetical protein